MGVRKSIIAVERSRKRRMKNEERGDRGDHVDVDFFLLACVGEVLVRRVPSLEGPGCGVKGGCSDLFLLPLPAVVCIIPPRTHNHKSP